MTNLYILAAVLFVIGLLIRGVRLLLDGKGAGGVYSGSPFPYLSQGKLVSAAERSFLGVLDQVIDDSSRIFAKVRLADIIKTKTGLSASARQTAFNRIQSKHLDFVVCDSGDLRILFVVELDDSSHKRASRQKRDAFLDQALTAAKVPFFRVPVKNGYSVAELEKMIGVSRNDDESDLVNG